MEKRPIKTREKKGIAEVIKLRHPDPLLIEIIQEMLEQAESGQLTSLVACVCVNGEDEFVLMGRPDQPAKTLGHLEMMKGELVYHMLHEREEM